MPTPAHEHNRRDWDAPVRDRQRFTRPARDDDFFDPLDTQGTPEQKALLSAWPVVKPRDWIRHVNGPQHEVEIEAIRNCLRRGQPFGSGTWVCATAEKLGLQATLRARGRPRLPSSEV